MTITVTWLLYVLGAIVIGVVCGALDRDLDESLVLTLLWPCWGFCALVFLALYTVLLPFILLWYVGTLIGDRI